ncbi:MAG: restriction endonuclease [Betaproteobacteria bacterium]|nr:restriction endonuclease [Betaproteobacteria bacterium]
MKWKMAENSLFAILLRQNWWVSALIALAVFGAVQNFMAWGYALFATTPFTVITLMVAWKQIRVPSGARLEKALEKLGYVTLVSARRWKVARTGAEPIRELVTAGEKQDARGCRHVVAGELTTQARAYAEERGVMLIEGVELAQRVGR